MDVNLLFFIFKSKDNCICKILLISYLNGILQENWKERLWYEVEEVATETVSIMFPFI